MRHINEETMQHLADVQSRHIEELMSLANVVGTGIGLAMKDGVYTDEPAIIVMVTLKMPLAQLNPMDVVPREIEDCRIDVQETGSFIAH